MSVSDVSSARATVAAAPIAAAMPVPARSAWSRIRGLVVRFPRDARALALRRVFPARLPAARGEKTIAIQSVEDALYFGLFNALHEVLRTQHGIEGELIIVRSINGAVGNDWRAALLRSWAFGTLVAGRWKRLYAGLVDRVAYRSQSLRPIGDAIDAARAFACWQRARRSNDDFELEIDGIPVGDLVIDSYLRFKPAPTFDRDDAFAWRIIWQAHRDVRRARRYFARRRPAAYVTSYAVYLEHGIAIRAALRAGTRVFSFGSRATFGKELTWADWHHHPDASRYRRDFDALPDPEPRLALAERGLSKRLAGVVDGATSYMKVSAYAKSDAAMPSDLGGAAIVFLHDFYDSPHVYGDLVFEDFFSWTRFVIDTFLAAGIAFFLKPHPNQIGLSAHVIARLRAMYPTVRWLDTRLTNVQLAEEGMSCGITMYGTVSHELAYLGVPSIACARHPHHSFEFCRTARSKGELADMLREPARLPVPKDELRRQALAFYYMHNLHGSSEHLTLRNGFVEFWKSCNDDAVTPAELAQQLRDWKATPDFVAFAQRLLTDPATPPNSLDQGPRRTLSS